MARRADTRIGHLGQTSNSSDGSRTITIHDVPTSEQGGPSTNGMEDGESSHHAGVLRLRGGGNTRRVVWTEETVDNEGMGKKKSKICCIYHKPKAFDQSSDESSSSVSDSEGSLSDMSETSASSHASADSSVNASQAMRDKASQANEQRKGKQKKKSSDCNGEHHHSSGHGRRLKRQAGGSNTIVEKESTEDKSIAYPVPNAYERGVS